VVPRGAHYGAVVFALKTYRIVTDGIRLHRVAPKDAETHWMIDPTQNAASPAGVGTCGAGLPLDASLCIKTLQTARIPVQSARIPEEGLEPSWAEAHWILSPATPSPKPQAAQEIRKTANAGVPSVVPTPLHGSSKLDS